MKSKRMLLLLLAVFVVLLGGASVLYNYLSDGMDHGMLLSQSGQSVTETDEKGELGTEEDGATQDTENATVPAPDFTVVDRDGNEVSLSDFVGKPVVVNFWASWCGPCKSEMPDFDAAYATYGEEIHFLMVNMTDGSRETVEVAKEFVEEQGYSFPVYFDTESSAAIAYGVYSIPSTYFIDAEGNAVAQARGAIDAKTLELGIGMIMSE